jgi:hypothetical protein
MAKGARGRTLRQFGRQLLDKHVLCRSTPKMLEKEGLDQSDPLLAIGHPT